MSYSDRIDNIIKNNKLYHFENEINDTNDESRKKIMTKIINDLTNISSEFKSAKDKMADHLILLKNSCYQRKWQFLTVEQRLFKFDEYVKKNNIIDNEYIDKVKSDIEAKKLLTKNVKYDNVNAKIDEIILK